MSFYSSGQLLMLDTERATLEQKRQTLVQEYTYRPYRPALLARFQGPNANNAT
jgi:hypothetical protein